MSEENGGATAPVQPIVSRRLLFDAFMAIAGLHMRDHRSSAYMQYWNSIAHRDDSADVIAASLIGWLVREFPNSRNIEDQDLAF